MPMDDELRQRLIEAYTTTFVEGGQFTSIIDARKYASEIAGHSIESGTPEAKLVEEAIEAGLVRAAQLILAKAETTHAGFDRLVDLYQRQPNLATRSSTSIRQQAYSTPIPIAYLAGTLAGLTPEKTVYEPTAGHGALILEAAPDRAIVNEINPDRATDLRRQGYTVTQQDATGYLPREQVDVVIMNPPFGGVKDAETDQSQEWRVRGGSATQPYRTTQIDHAIALHALQAMKDDGRAVLILGAPMSNKVGNDRKASNTYNNAQNRAFFKSLYDNYNVTQHFCIAGNLYGKQGTSFPVDVIVIEGRGKSQRRLPAADLPKIYTTFEDLKELIPDVPRSRSRMATPDPRFDRSPVNSSFDPQREPASTSGGLHESINAAIGLDDAAGQSSDRSDSDAASGESGTALSDQSTADQRTESGVGTGTHDVQLRVSRAADVSASSGFNRGSEPSGISAGSDFLNSESQEIDSRNNVERVARANGGGMQLGDEQMDSQEQEIKQVPYTPRSQGNSVETLVPVNMQTAVSNALKKLERQVGQIDQYVTGKLGVEDTDTLHSRFSAEQVDALGLAIANLEKNESFIIGDQTGIGKGRFVAGVIEYARKQGLTPIFVTQDPKLYGDIIRDLSDIGVKDVKPLPTNNGLNIPLPDGTKLKTAAADSHARLIKRLTATADLGEYDAIFTTYSQMQTVKGKDTDRRDFLRTFAPRSILILDESHNAGGTPKQWKDNFAAPDRADFVRELVRRSAGVVYSSATYAKNPYVMTLYSAKTGMRHAVENEENLVPMIQSGGIPLQQMLAAKLSEAGQYIRRERSYEGIEFAAKVAAVDTEMAENLAGVMSRIMEFDLAKKESIKALDDQLKADAKRQLRDNSTGGAGATSTNFTSIMHNVINQTLLAMKAEATVQEALNSLQRGEKPVITVANTMGSIIGRAADEQGLKPGDPIDLDVGDLLRRYLERSREVTLQDYEGNSTRYRLTDEELEGTALDLYEECVELIEHTDWSSVPISPIDYIRHRLDREGYRVNEVTGREDRIEYAPNGEQFYQIRTSGEKGTAAAIKHVNAFNAGDLDVIILNRSGSTGISLHASEKFLDQRPRRMIIAQPELNIDQFMQMLGRIHRTGQVEKPSFTILMGDIPAEKRPAAVLLKKMASLNANTTAARESGFSLGNVTDFMNEYGDQVVLELMANRPDIHAKLGYPIRGLGEESEIDHFETDGLVNKVTGRIPLLPVAQQEEIYNLIEQEYRELVEREKAMGQSILEAETLDLDAKTLARMELAPAKTNIDSPFTAVVYLEVVDAKAQRKPMTTLEVVNAVRSELELSPVEQVEQHDKIEVSELAKTKSAEMIQALRSRTFEYRAEHQSRLNKQYVKLDAEEQIKKLSGAMERLDAKLNDQFTHVSRIMRNFPVGTPIALMSENDGVFYGVVEKYVDRSGAGANPTLPSNWKMQVQVADSACQIVIPLSRVNTDRVNSVQLEAREQTRAGTQIYDLFDQRQTLGREKRQIFTGNVIRAFEQFPNGKLVNFTDARGNVRQGLLMKQGFDIEKALDERPVRMPTIEDCQQFFDTTKAKLKTQDEVLQVWKTGDDGLIMVSPKMKATGGRYYLDEELLEAAQTEFVSIGDRMEMRVDSEQATPVLQYLYSSGNPLFAFEKRDQAREMLGIEIPNLETVEAATEALLDELPPYVEELELVDQVAVVAQLESLLNRSDVSTQDIEVAASELDEVPVLPIEIELAIRSLEAEHPSLEFEDVAEEMFAIMEEEGVSWQEAIRFAKLRRIAQIRQELETNEEIQVQTQAEAQTERKALHQEEIKEIGQATQEVIGEVAELAAQLKVVEPVLLSEKPLASKVVASTESTAPEFSKVVDLTQRESSEYSPTLQQMRDWSLDARILGRPKKYVDRIKELSQDMLDGTAQAALPVKERDPNFVNPEFQLSEAAHQAMHRDAAESGSVRTPTRSQLITWFQAARELGQDGQLNHIKQLGQAQLKGTEQEAKPSNERDPGFSNPNFQLDRKDYIAMQKTVAEYQKNISRAQQPTRFTASQGR
ncbi:strawberry notch C-terminal domain-containing protein [Cyanobacteria bacterium FACHB-63]|nr:strawberry notch C-terminal domain-containing protein [Cyanobacteria bacterium FACHB-63]